MLSINKIWYFHTNLYKLHFFIFILFLYYINDVSQYYLIFHISPCFCFFLYCRTIIAILSHEFQTVHRYAYMAIKHLPVVKYITNAIKYCNYMKNRVDRGIHRSGNFEIVYFWIIFSSCIWFARFENVIVRN